MTQLTYDLSRAMAKEWRTGDEIVVTRLDHDANVRPWVQAAESVGATVRWVDFDPDTGEWAPSAWEAVLTERTRLVALTAASNLIGTIPDVRAVAEAAHAAGAWVYVDGVHATAHLPIDVEALGADFFACSPYKFLGPHCGVVAGRVDLLERLRPDKLLPATDDVPERFELGTLPYELMAGATAAVDFLASWAPPAVGERRDRVVAAMRLIETHENALRERVEKELAQLPGATIWSRAARRTPTLLVSFDRLDASELSRSLGEQGVNAPAGSFYAIEAARRLGLGETGGLRIGLAPYTDDSDVERLLEALSTYVGGHPA